jgi:protein-S-isoprenylcysteine O-methyltransferase Ste14
VIRIAEAVKQAGSMKETLWGSSISSIFLGPALVLVCLRQWGTNLPWSRVDLYSGSFLVLGLIVAVEETITFGRSACRSKEVAREALGLTYDPALFGGGTALNGAVLLVVLDYAHWHLVPALERPLLQGIGVLLGILGVIWQTWADVWLARHFADDRAARRLMTGGPFRFVRHPRYAGFLVRKLAWPLLFASVIGWALLPIWLVLVLRRMDREEAHMSELYGAEYIVYLRRTSRLLPGVY